MNDYNKPNRPKVWTDLDNEMPDKPVEKWETNNLALAVTLSLNFELLDILKGQSTMRYGRPFIPTIFIFPRSEGLQKAVDEYWEDKSLVNPLAFYRQLQNIRTRIHELLNS